MVFSWQEGKVVQNEEHFLLYYGDNNTKADEWPIVAMIGRLDNEAFTVQWIIDKTCQSQNNIMAETLKEIDFYLVAKGEEDPWAYAKYHCTTAANIYSCVHWRHIKKNKKRKS